MIETWTYNGNFDDLVVFVTKHRIALYAMPFHDEPPYTPFLVGSEGIFPIHNGDVITKEWFDKSKHQGAFDFDLIAPAGTKVIELDMQPFIWPVGVQTICGNATVGKHEI